MWNCTFVDIRLCAIVVGRQVEFSRDLLKFAEHTQKTLQKGIAQGEKHINW